MLSLVATLGTGTLPNDACAERIVLGASASCAKF
jgi:hypothetical protein